MSARRRQRAMFKPIPEPELRALEDLGAAAVEVLADVPGTNTGKMVRLFVEKFILGVRRDVEHARRQKGGDVTAAKHRNPQREAAGQRILQALSERGDTATAREIAQRAAGWSTMRPQQQRELIERTRGQLRRLRKRQDAR